MRDPSRRVAARHPASVLSYDIETIAPPAPDAGFPPWPTHRPIAIGFAGARSTGYDWTFDIDAMIVGDGVDEAALVREADRRLASADIATGYNSRQFDALVLRLTAQRARAWNLKALADHAACPRFDGAHADLADLYSSYGRKVGLSALCDEIGIPAKTSVSGGDVAALWEAGESDRIRDYVMEDAVATLCLYFAWAAGRAANEALVARPLAALARYVEATPALACLEPFVDCALTRWARPRAMAVGITAALTRVTEKLKREEAERAFSA